jgi:hypothetical protein
MLHRVLRIHVQEWQDRDFVHAFESALEEARMGREDATGADDASTVEATLRSGGYREARVECRSGVDDVLAGVVRWAVCRGALTDGRD